MLLGKNARRILVALVASLFTVIIPGIARAQLGEDGRWENGVSEAWWFVEKLPPEEIATVISRWKLIEDENGAAAANEWAGDYFRGGDTHGSYLRLSPKNGFVLLHVNKCAAQVMAFSYGRVEITPTSIHFLTEKSFSPSDSHAHMPAALTLNFLPVKWRYGYYLVTEKEISEFADYVAGLGKYNPSLAGYWIDGIDFFFKRAKSDIGTADELPIVPLGYERFLKKPIDARITSVGARVVRKRQSTPDDEPYYESETTVVVNVGRAHGVRNGMSLHLASPSSAEVVIRRVGNRSSVGVIVRFVEKETDRPPALWKDNQNMDYPPIMVGSELTTSLHRIAAMRDAN